jgi:hypothetical protein
MLPHRSTRINGWDKSHDCRASLRRLVFSIDPAARRSLSSFLPRFVIGVPNACKAIGTTD